MYYFIISTQLSFLILICFTLNFLSWVNPLLYKGYKKDLEQNDLYEALDDDKSDALGKKLQRYEVDFDMILESRSNCICFLHFRGWILKMIIKNSTISIMQNVSVRGMRSSKSQLMRQGKMEKTKNRNQTFEMCWFKLLVGLWFHLGLFASLKSVSYGWYKKPYN